VTTALERATESHIQFEGVSKRALVGQIGDTPLTNE
jgi:hypothetical protein